jgi:predicted protein tyrosine phosphatase
MRVLYVCTIGRCRSLTAAALTRLETNHYASFRGIAEAKILEYKNIVLQSDIQLADKIVCFEKKHRDYLYTHHNVHPKDTVLWNIPDDYDAFNPELVAILRPLIHSL